MNVMMLKGIGVEFYHGAAFRADAAVIVMLTAEGYTMDLLQVFITSLINYQRKNYEICSCNGISYN